MKITISEAAAFLKERDAYLILTHTRPDGDTLGCAGALALALRSMGKKAWVYHNPEITEKYKPYVADVLAEGTEEIQTVLAVDIASENMLPIGAENMAGQVELCVDHHPSNTDYAHRTHVQGKSASCGEVLLQLFHELQVELTTEMATRLYVAIATDTGCFLYNGTTEGTFMAAAELVAKGVPNGAINKIMFRTKPVSRIKLEGMLYEAMEYYKDNQIVFMPVMKAVVQESGADENAMDDLAAIPGQIEGVLAAATIKELDKNRVKVSLRTQPGINASAVCAHFGGGGHSAAAGCMIPSPMEEAKKKLLQALEEEWNDPSTVS